MAQVGNEPIYRILTQSLAATSLKHLHIGDRVHLDMELFQQARQAIPDLIVLGNKFFPFS